MPESHEWDRLVNSVWPSDMPIPSAKEAITGAKRLYRRAMGRPFKGKVVVTSGNRYTWVRRGVMYVNPNSRWGRKGWPEIVHLLAHYCHSRKHPNARPHDHRELDMEADLTRYAIASGFHLGKLKRPEMAKKPKPDLKTSRRQAAEAALKRWQTKQKRTETAIKKYRRKIRYYEKALSGEA
jgi:hypothetical protein